MQPGISLVVFDLDTVWSPVWIAGNKMSRLLKMMSANLSHRHGTSSTYGSLAR